MQLSSSFAIGDIVYVITASPIRGQAEARRHLTRGNCAAQVVGQCDLDYNSAVCK